MCLRREFDDDLSYVQAFLQISVGFLDSFRIEGRDRMNWLNVTFRVEIYGQRHQSPCGGFVDHCEAERSTPMKVWLYSNLSMAS